MYRFIITGVTEVSSWNTLIRIAVYDKGLSIHQPLLPFLLSVAYRNSYCSKHLMVKNLLLSTEKLSIHS